MSYRPSKHVTALLRGAALMALIFAALGVQSVVAQTYCNNTGKVTLSGNNIYENWRDLGSPPSGRTQNSCMTLSGDTFSANWENIFNYLARRGLGYNETQKPSSIGWFTVDYTVNYQPNCSKQGSNSYMGVYGWMSDNTKTSPNDLVEWYILDGWCNYNPAQGSQPFATININGTAQYDFVQALRDDKPSIKNNTSDDFRQYFSVKRDSNTNGTPVTLSGTVDVSEHFRYWELLGMPAGNLYEVSMLVEGYGHGNNSNGKTDPTGTGSATFTEFGVNVGSEPENNLSGTVSFSGYQVLDVEGRPAQLAVTSSGVNGHFPKITMVVMDGDDDMDFDSDGNGSKDSNRQDNADVSITGNGGTYWFISPIGEDKVSIVDVYLYRSGVLLDSMKVTVGGDTSAGNKSKASASAMKTFQFRALGTTGQEQVAVTLNGAQQRSYVLTQQFQTYSGAFIGNGDVGIEFTNDDGITNGRDVRLDYLEVNGNRRETEDMAENSGAYANGVCGGGAFTEWLHCSGAVNYGEVEEDHTITIRARGNKGGEHISLLINGQPVNGGWNLGTTYQTYTAVVRGDGDINVRYDNDGGQRDAIIDWLKVDNQNLRQAESMQYNTGAFANGKCGGGSYTQWMHCNGVIGFGNISDNY